MSEIRSQATPEVSVRDRMTRIARTLLVTRQYHSPSMAMLGLIDALADDGWSKPRTVNSAAELKALPTCSLIRGLEREGQRSGDVFEKVGLDHWLALDPGDRFDGEETTPSHAIVLIYKAGIRVLFTPGEAG